MNMHHKCSQCATLHFSTMASLEKHYKSQHVKARDYDAILSKIIQDKFDSIDQDLEAMSLKEIRIMLKDQPAEVQKKVMKRRNILKNRLRCLKWQRKKTQAIHNLPSNKRRLDVENKKLEEENLSDEKENREMKLRLQMLISFTDC